jgi:hypothetical protein
MFGVSVSSVTNTAQVELRSGRVKAPGPAYSSTFRLDVSTFLWDTLGGFNDKTIQVEPTSGRE